MNTTHLIVNGMNCGACVQHVTRALEETAGVQNAEVDLSSGRAAVQHDASTQAEALTAAVTDAGYEAEVVNSTDGS